MWLGRGAVLGENSAGLTERPAALSFLTSGLASYLFPSSAPCSLCDLAMRELVSSCLRELPFFPRVVVVFNKKKSGQGGVD